MSLLGAFEVSFTPIIPAFVRCSCNIPLFSVIEFGVLHEHLTKAGIIGVNETSKAPRSDIQHIEEDADSEATGKKCVIC
jgi:hypothetical protein